MKMNIVICLNKGYLMPTTVMLCSLFENNKGEQICVHALLGEGGEMCISPLKALAEKYCQSVPKHMRFHRCYHLRLFHQPLFWYPGFYDSGFYHPVQPETHAGIQGEPA